MPGWFLCSVQETHATVSTWVLYSRDSLLAQAQVLTVPLNWQIVSKRPQSYFLQKIYVVLPAISTTPQNNTCWFMGCLSSLTPSHPSSTEYSCSIQRPLILPSRFQEILLKRWCVNHDHASSLSVESFLIPFGYPIGIRGPGPCLYHHDQQQHILSLYFSTTNTTASFRYYMCLSVPRSFLISSYGVDDSHSS